MTKKDEIEPTEESTEQADEETGDGELELGEGDAPDAAAMAQADLGDDDVSDGDLNDGDLSDGEEPPVEVTKPPPRKRASAKGGGPLQGVTRAKLDDPKVAKEVWAKLREQVGEVEGRDYSIRELFAPDDIIEHKTFGQGFVIATPGGTQVEVLFADQVRRLVQGR